MSEIGPGGVRPTEKGGRAGGKAGSGCCCATTATKESSCPLIALDSRRWPAMTNGPGTVSWPPGCGPPGLAAGEGAKAQEAGSFLNWGTPGFKRN